MSATLPGPPASTPLTESAKTGIVTAVWYHWIVGLLSRVQKAAYVLARGALTAQGAAIALTAIVPSAASGLYRVSWYLRITQAATTSSSVTVSIVTTDGTVVVTQSGTAVTGNTTDTVQSGVVTIRADASAPIQYSTAYASVGATAMEYSLDVLVEQM